MLWLAALLHALAVKLAAAHSNMRHARLSVRLLRGGNGQDGREHVRTKRQVQARGNHRSSQEQQLPASNWLPGTSVGMCSAHCGKRAMQAC